MLVAVDTNVIDLIDLACQSAEHVDAMEAMEPPPRFADVPQHQEAEVFACYWLLAIAPAWRSVAYTYSDWLYDEIGRAERATRLARITWDVLIRDLQPPRCRIPDGARRPDTERLMELGVKHIDAEHVADAIGLGCHRFVTNDLRLRRKSDPIETRWGLQLRRPTEFLVESVRAGASWTTRAPWPWESLARIAANP